jgi:signal transduction histidine kinase/ActR/RegA family two-component response regulator
VWRLYAGALRRVHNAGVYAMALTVFLACAINDVFVTLHAYPGVFLADPGFMVTLIAASIGVTKRVADDARELETLSASLGRMISQRTEELIRLRERLEQSERLALIGRLAASVEHEINNPLSYVMANLELAKEETEGLGATQASEVLGEALDGARRIREIVADLRAFARNDESMLDDSCDVQSALEDARRMTRGVLEPRARLRVDIREPYRVALAPQRLVQVLINLLRNAAEALTEGAHRTEDIVVSARACGDGFVCIEIRDYGEGMSAETRSRLFEPFFTTKPIGKGTGLGLFVTAEIVRRVGGEITVESALGEGTTIRIRLPIAEGPRRSEASSASGVGVPARTRVLVVDDDPRAGRALCRALRGHEVEVAASGEAALAVVESGERFDVVLCDLIMPEMSGPELYARVCARWPELAKRFLFVTGGASSEAAAAFAAENLGRLLYKPVERETLLERIGELVAAIAKENVA